jgi:hypothetical protein
MRSRSSQGHKGDSTKRCLTCLSPHQLASKCPSRAKVDSATGVGNAPYSTGNDSSAFRPLTSGPGRPQAGRRATGAQVNSINMIN